MDDRSLLMKDVMKCLLVASLSAALAPTTFAKTTLSDEEIKQQIIRESIASYPGRCPCPYNAASNGSSCGRRSAYSKPGGYAPICYPADVTPQMVERYKSRLN